MDNLFGGDLSLMSGIFLVVALLLAFSFEFVNGFHDTANAVATVIYTNALPAWIAVIWSGCWNLIGVLLSAGTVAFGILALLPVELVLNVGSGAGFAMVFSLLISAIIWNIGTWYFGLPASSSHTLIGSIVGVGLANSVLSAGHTFGDGVNWGKVQDTLTALLVSPVVGFVGSALLLLLLKFLVRRPELYREPDAEKPPTPWIRALLILTCTGVSFAHGSNDGQKGMGLVLLILIGVIPGTYALNLALDGKSVASLYTQSQAASATLATLTPAGAPAAAPANDAPTELNRFLKSSAKVSAQTIPAIAQENALITSDLAGKTTIADVPKAERKNLRSAIYLVSNSIAKLNKSHAIADAAAAKSLGDYHKALDKVTNFIPLWVKVAVAFALGLGTMIGWKRIVVTVGERIGKSHLTYGQGASAEIVTYATIQTADIFGLPVSTTHILSSGVAGTMFANHSGLQAQTLRNILLAWVLTLPVTVFLGSFLFAFGLRLVAALGMH
ncbi:MAG: inorganic phosphate transporter [Candidatus Velthaea sp.]